MSRARPIVINGEQKWFDRKRSHLKATADQLEYLASAENIELDDLLDEGLTQAEVLERLRDALGLNGVPVEIEQRREAKRKERQKLPECRICEGIGNSTRHHFINKWIMKELHNYLAYSHRSICTIPVCVECHRDLHSKDESDKSIVPYLSEKEMQVAGSMLEDLERERPALFELLKDGDLGVYESRLVQDYIEGLFET